jgi:dihydropteroate synthase
MPHEESQPNAKQDDSKTPAPPQDSSWIVFLDADAKRLDALVGILPHHPHLQRLALPLSSWRQAFALSPPPWIIRGRPLAWEERPAIMGILNCTPDSFSDGGRFFHPEAAIECGLRLIEEGAQILDIGGESTRPGAEPVEEAEEMRRVLPVIEGLRRYHLTLPLSIDTYKARTAEAALEAGADIINDISGLRFDPRLARVAAQKDAFLILMHSRHTPQKMQERPYYKHLWLEILSELSQARDLALQAGVSPQQIALDPGIGFGKRDRDNFRILREIPAMRGLQHPILIGASRKSFLGRLLQEDDPQKRLESSLATASYAALAGTQILRVHDVAPTRKMLDTLAAIRASF